MNEHELIDAIAKGDQQAFRLLVDTYKKRVFNTVLGFLQNIENAEEVTQDVFVKVYETLGNFKRESKLSTWIYRISVNQALDFIRKTKRKKRFGIVTSLFGEENEVLHQPANFEHPGVVLEKKEKAAILFSAINSLPEKQKTAFLLQKIEQCNQQKIAEIMQLNEGAVESLLSRAKTNLKRQLINYYSA